LKNKIIIGITGLPGTGKTEVLRIMEEEDFFVIEGDRIAHEIFHEKKEHIDKIFGKKGITKKEVARIIFEDRIKRQEFESFIHPIIINRIFTEVQEIKHTYIAIEGTLIFELKTEEKFDLIITVASDISSIYDRMRRKGFDNSVINSMIERGFSQDEKIKRADICIDNRGTLDDLRKKVKRLCRVIKGK